MEKLYKRIGNLEEKIKEISLPYLQWKLLFLIGEPAGTDKLVPVVQKTVEEVEKALAGLESSGLIEVLTETDASQPDVMEEMPAAEPEELTKPQPEAEEAAPEIEDEAVPQTVSDETSIFIDNETSDEEVEVAETDKNETVSAAEELVELLAEPEETAEDNEISGFDELPDEPDITIAGEEEAEEEKENTDDSESEMTQFIEELGELEQGLGLTDEAEVETTAAGPKSKKEPETVDDVVSVSGQKSILVIDDSLVIRKMVEMALEDEDYALNNSSTGRGGLDLLDKTDPILVILDLILPDMNGIDVLKTIKASKGIPVIMLSGKDNPQLIENAKAEGADAFLPKPFKDEDLVEKIKRLTNQ